MKIALLAPAGAMHRHGGSFGKSLHYAPLTLSTLASLTPADIEAEIAVYDETIEKIPLNLQADLVCMTAITGTCNRVYKYADYFRSNGMTVGLGGVHPTIMPQEAGEHADFVMTGFAEQTWAVMLHDFLNNNLKKLYTQNADYTIENKPIPMRDLLKRSKYITSNSVEAVRGCSLPCVFCAYPAAFGRTIYKRPINEVIAEIEQLNSKEVLFPDVNLIADRQYAIELFTAMIPLKKMWFGLVTSSVGIDDELIGVFKKSRCRGLLIGFESFVSGSQSFIHKGVNKVGGYAELMEKMHDAGILIQGCFAFGGDEEDTDVFYNTVEMVDKIKIDLPRYSILTPFPGTELYRDLDSQGRIVEKDWAMYDVEHCVFEPAKMTKEQLEQGIEWAWRETYKMKSIIHRLAPFKIEPAIAFALNLGYKGYANKFAKFTKEVMTDNSDIPSVAPQRTVVMA